MNQEYLFLLSFVRYTGYAWIAKGFSRKYLEGSRHTGKVFGILLFFSYVAGNMVCLRISYLAGISFIHLTLFGLILLLFQGESEKKILAAAILAGCMELTGRFISSGFNLLLLVIYHVKKGETVVDYGSVEESLFGVLQLMAMTMTVRLLEKPLISVMGRKIKKWYIVAAIPLIALIVMLDITEWSATKGIMFWGGDRWNLYYNQLFSHGANLILAVLCMCAAGFYIFGMNKIYMEQRQNGRHQSQIAVYKMLEEQYRQTERLRHDMRNHITGLQGLLEHREWEKIKEYLQKMADTGALGGNEEATGNKVVDALLYQKRKEAEGKKILWEADMQVPKECGIDDFDFCVVIGNVLDNALEACEKLEETEEKFITIQSGRKKDFFLLEAKNSTNLKELGCISHTDKTGSGIHGTGLFNILETAEKYNGAVETELEHGIFTISVLLPIPEPYMTSGRPFETKG